MMEIKIRPEIKDIEKKITQDQQEKKMVLWKD